MALLSIMFGIIKRSNQYYRVPHFLCVVLSLQNGTMRSKLGLNTLFTG